MTHTPDAGCKLLFSAPEIVRDLITGFIGDPWVDQLDLDTLEKLPTVLAVGIHNGARRRQEGL